MKKRLVIFFLAAAMVLGGCENKNSKLYKKGIEALEQKDYVTSIAMLEGAVKAGDRLAESYRSLGIAYLKSQEYDKAKEAGLLTSEYSDKAVQMPAYAMLRSDVARVCGAALEIKKPE